MYKYTTYIYIYVYITYIYAFNSARCWWLMLIILTTWEAEIGKMMVQGQLGR
jgi:hypothetical protein